MMISLTSASSIFLAILTIAAPALGNCTQEEIRNARADGCSGPISNSYTEVCNNHDICYSTLGNSKEDCDNKMKEEMLSVCRAEVAEIVSQTDDGNTAFMYTACETEAAITRQVLQDHDSAQNGYNANQEWARNHCQ